jgi:NADPH-dependent 2,4-dienoyl-CoA reductase/sulfur reductase-like enzyme/peroxiredoxin family protein/rhodanese-related sulfurtransferase/TusA-related sulfurtransferase
MKVLIIGGVAGGASAAARLRRLDERAQIILLERGEHISFANCGLPYYIGGEIRQKSALTLQTPNSFNARFNVDVRVLSEAVKIDAARKVVAILNHTSGATYEESYDKLILSPGAEPFVPPIEGAKSDKVFTLRNIPDTYRIKEYIDREKPRSAIVAGGGFIGVEMAENLVAAGLFVTLVEMADQVIAPIDYDMAADVHRHIEEKGVRLMCQRSVDRIVPQDGGLMVTVGGQQIASDLLIMAVGVRPESHLAREAGLNVNPRGAIVVDERMTTSDPDIYAVGDAVEITDFVTGQKGYVPLAGPANKQGRIAADNICGLDSRYQGTQGSSILKVFDMTVAATGVNEKTAKRLGLDYDKSFTYSANHAGYYPGAVNMSIKTLFERGTGRILGAQVVGYEGADKRCDVLATAIRAHMTARDLTELELCYAPPFGSAKDPVNMAGFAIENLLKGLVKNFHWHDVAALPRDGSATLLDVRTDIEYANSHIEGFINIPLDSLRARLGELDLSKPVYITCQVGLRGYVAARILMQNGFDAYNLSGGYRLYRSIFGPHDLPEPSVPINTDTQLPQDEAPQDEAPPAKTVVLDACGLQCPGPIVKLSEALINANIGDLIEISSTDPAFASDLTAYCRRTGNVLVETQSQKGISRSLVKKGEKPAPAADGAKDAKNIIVFSGDLDKAIASFIIASAAAAMGRRVTMFFTFWGLNILRKPEKVGVQKDLISKMFGAMMPRGSRRLGLSKMNMLGIGSKMIRGVMKKKNIASLEELIDTAQKSGVELIACSMSLDVMGIKPEELIDGVQFSGAAAMLANAEESDMSLFI